MGNFPLQGEAKYEIKSLPSGKKQLVMTCEIDAERDLISHIATSSPAPQRLISHEAGAEGIILAHIQPADDQGQALIVRCFGKDKIGIISGFVKKIDSRHYYIRTFDFVLRGFRLDEYSLQADIRGNNLKSLRDKLDKQEMEGFVPSEYTQWRREDTDPASCALYALNLIVYDKEGIVGGVADIVSRKSGNFLWLRGDTGNESQAIFRLSAVAEFNSDTDISVGLRESLEELCEDRGFTFVSNDAQLPLKIVRLR
ncbi:MAG: hypothetical protein ACKVW3_14765 [Phycisphaerales bacterium]